MLLDIIYLIALVLASPWLLFRAVTTGRYREGFAERALGRVPRLPEYRDGPTFWLHAVSVGEVNLLPLLVKRLEEACPKARCVISATTKTGMEVARKRFGESHTVFYFPLDFSWSTREALKRIQPSALLLAELEVWPNLVEQARKRNVPVIVFNGRISDNSFESYRKARFALRSTFSKLALVISQSRQSSERFEALGVPKERIVTVGSIKFDGARTDRDCDTVRKVRALTGCNDQGERWRPLDNASFVFLAGSTQDPEEEMALSSFLTVSDSCPQARLILVPRHPERFDAVAETLSRKGVSFIRRTQLHAPQEPGFACRETIELSENEGKVSAPSERSDVRVLLVDAMGELGAWWGVANLAFVGGSMGSRGGQNMIEPAAYGAAVSFGPNTRNFRDIVALLLDADAAVVIHDNEEMTRFVQRGVEDSAWRMELGNRARELVLSQTGAADKTVELILSVGTANSST